MQGYTNIYFFCKKIKENQLFNIWYSHGLTDTHAILFYGTKWNVWRTLFFQQYVCISVCCFLWKLSEIGMMLWTDCFTAFAMTDQRLMPLKLYFLFSCMGCWRLYISWCKNPNSYNSLQRSLFAIDNGFILQHTFNTFTIFVAITNTS